MENFGQWFDSKNMKLISNLSQGYEVSISFSWTHLIFFSSTFYNVTKKFAFYNTIEKEKPVMKYQVSSEYKKVWNELISK